MNKLAHQIAIAERAAIRVARGGDLHRESIAVSAYLLPGGGLTQDFEEAKEAWASWARTEGPATRVTQGQEEQIREAAAELILTRPGSADEILTRAALVESMQVESYSGRKLWFAPSGSYLTDANKAVQLWEAVVCFYGHPSHPERARATFPKLENA